MDVKVYSTNSCYYCVKVKEYFTKLGIKFKEIDVEKNQKEADYIIKKTGQMGVPVIIIDGEVVVGFNKEKIDKLIKPKN